MTEFLGSSAVIRMKAGHCFLRLGALEIKRRFKSEVQQGSIDGMAE